MFGLAIWNLASKDAFGAQTGPYPPIALKLPLLVSPRILGPSPRRGPIVRGEGELCWAQQTPSSNHVPRAMLCHTHLPLLHWSGSKKVCCATKSYGVHKWGCLLLCGWGTITAAGSWCGWLGCTGGQTNGAGRHVGQEGFCEPKLCLKIEICHGLGGDALPVAGLWGDPSKSSSVPAAIVENCGVARKRD